MKEKADQGFSIDQIKNHPILSRVVQSMEERLVNGEDTTAHTAHNSHYSSLSKNDAEEVA